MHYVSAENLTKSFGIYPLFKNISFNISEGDKIALVARNGIGKSTLLKILAGTQTPDDGKLWINKEVTVALFEQNPIFDEEKTIIQNIFLSQNPTFEAVKNYESAVESNNPDQIAKAIVEMDESNAWQFETEVKQILGKLNIHDVNRGVNHLSGGERKRVALAKILIEVGFEHKHVLLMMDEPTNHLDIEMIEWLEHFLNKQSITLLLVTHDRYFLDAVCEEIWELERSELYVYKGDYENYLEKKDARIQSELSSIEKAKNLYRKELEWMRKQPKARTTKSKSRQDNFYDVEAKAHQKIQDANLQLQMKMNRLGGKIVELKKIYKTYNEKPILRGFDYTFSKGERIGIIGKNGVGKSTFLNVLQGIELPDSGKVNIGDTVVFGNFSQKGLEFKEDMRVIEYVKTFAESFPLAKGGSLSAGQFLELFLFTPEKQHTYLSSLSGGEKKRLQLLTVLFRNPNFLILDEPTNDLDLPTLSVVENFLSEYEGCLLMVSHDRYFMDRLVDHLFVFEGDAVIKDFPGNYSQYREWIKQQEKNEVKEKENQFLEKPPSNHTVKKKLSYKEKKEFEQLEKDMEKLEKEKQQLANELMNPDLPYEKIEKISNRLNEINEEIEVKEMRWMELADGME